MITEDPVFLTVGGAIEIHRDLGLLQSALAIPAAGFGGRYLHTDLFEIVAAYLIYITRKHPFIDGNKRTGAVASLVCLFLDDVEVEADEEELERIVLGVARGNIEKASVAEFYCGFRL